MATQRRYILGPNVYQGYIAYEDAGVFTEYNPETIRNTRGLLYLKNFLEDITVRACMSKGYDYALIRSILHATTGKRENKIITQPHVTITAGFYLDQRPTPRASCHIFTRGFDPGVNYNRWYDNVVIDRIGWVMIFKKRLSDGSASANSDNGNRPGGYRCGQISSSRGYNNQSGTYGETFSTYSYGLDSSSGGYNYQESGAYSETFNTYGLAYSSSGYNTQSGTYGETFNTYSLVPPSGGHNNQAFSSYYQTSSNYAQAQPQALTPGSDQVTEWEWIPAYRRWRRYSYTFQQWEWSR